MIALTGNGDAFCSGLDLGGGDDRPAGHRAVGAGARLDEKGWVGRFLLALRLETDKPVVVGLNGVAVGAGLSLAMAADIRIAADTARLHPGYLRAGALARRRADLVASDARRPRGGPSLPARVPVRRRGGGAPPRVRVRGRARRPSSTAGSWRSARASPPRHPSRCGGRRHSSPGRRWSPTWRRGWSTRSATRSPVSTARTARRRCGRHVEKRAPTSEGADVTDRAAQQQAAIDEFLDLLHHERTGEAWGGQDTGLVRDRGLRWGRPRPHHQRRVPRRPAGSRLHSLHAHFLRPVQGGSDIVFRTRGRQGRPHLQPPPGDGVAGRQGRHHDDLFVHG